MGFERGFAFIVGTPLILLIEVIRYIKALKCKRKFLNYREVLFFTLLLYIVVLCSITLLPFYTGMNIEPTFNIVPIVNTIKDIMSVPKGMEIYMLKFWVINIIGNLLLLVPLSILIPANYKKFRNIKNVILLCFLVSLGIEIIQYLSMYLGNMRSVDIDDVILNTTGALLGYLIFKFVDKKISSKV